MVQNAVEKREVHGMSREWQDRQLASLFSSLKHEFGKARKKTWISSKKYKGNQCLTFGRRSQGRRFFIFPGRRKWLVRVVKQPALNNSYALFYQVNPDCRSADLRVLENIEVYARQKSLPLVKVRQL
jgi:hypothetical protein